MKKLKDNAFVAARARYLNKEGHTPWPWFRERLCKVQHDPNHDVEERLALEEVAKVYEQRAKLVKALTDCAESLRHSIEDMKSAGETGWRVQMREERLAEAERVLREVNS